MSIRDEIRALVLADANLKRHSITVNFFGADIELRQPTTGDIIRSIEDESRKMTLVRVLLDYAYVPGTDEKVFEEGDIPVLEQLPYNSDMKALTKAIEAFTNILVGDAEKN